MRIPAKTTKTIRAARERIRKRNRTREPFVPGKIDLTYEDPGRDRSLRCALWYPARAGTKAGLRFLGGMFYARHVPDAEPDATTTRPLILLSHGSGGTRYDLCWLAERLAANGMIAIAVEHPGNRFGDNTRAGVIRVWERPQDLSILLDQFLDHPRFGDLIDRERIGAAGFSSGGYTAIALAGAVYNLNLLKDYVESPNAGADAELASQAPGGPEPVDPTGHDQSYRDERVRAVFAMAPAVGPGFDRQGLASVKIPVSIAAGMQDEIVPFRFSAAHYAKYIDGAELHAFRRGGHFLFMPECNPLGRIMAPMIARDPAGVLRSLVHERVSNLALEFFGRTLRPR